jgi:GH3 auxin-responsive promoter
MNTILDKSSVQALWHSDTDSETTQKEVLLHRIVAPNASCEFGRRHGFAAIRSIREFQQGVPVRSYEDFRSDIERMARGEAGVLTSEPVRRFFITSGSMSQPKYIPVTPSFVRDKSRAFQVFWNLVRETYPGVSRGSLVCNFSDSGHEQRTAGGLLCSSETSFWNACWRGMSGKIRSPFPREVADIADAEVRYYTIARILLEMEVAVLMTLNPSTVLFLWDVISRNFQMLVDDVARGGLCPRVAVAAPREIREYMAAQFQGNKLRAQELEKAFVGNDVAIARRLWPNLQLVVCWRSPMVRPYLELLAPFLGDVPQRDYLTMASEGIIAIPLQNEVSGGVLPIHTHFYEFVPEKLAEEDNPQTLLAHQLEVGKNYAVVLTTSAGMYRYNIGDIVRVNGFHGSTPALEFLHRAGHTCSLTGEKLTESQVVEAVSEAACYLGLKIGTFMLCPASRPYPHYVLLAEFEAGLGQPTSSRFLAALDVCLGKRNMEYRAKRSSHRLGAPELCFLRAGSYAELQQARIAAGINDAQVKPACLSRDLDWDKQFQILERVSCESLT